jgi:hypothetical protein
MTLYRNCFAKKSNEFRLWRQNDFTKETSTLCAWRQRSANNVALNAGLPDFLMPCMQQNGINHTLRQLAAKSSSVYTLSRML